jgi:hypothetical protein
VALSTGMRMENGDSPLLHRIVVFFHIRAKGILQSPFFSN